ncbi:MAG: hypothetical protein HZB16_21115 [Armatimonadetes bacterium]|nr:hypothetical protein [Armatimonadota bacterium]
MSEPPSLVPYHSLGLAGETPIAVPVNAYFHAPSPDESRPWPHEPDTYQYHTDQAFLVDQVTLTGHPSVSFGVREIVPPPLMPVIAVDAMYTAPGTWVAKATVCIYWGRTPLEPPDSPTENMTVLWPMTVAIHINEDGEWSCDYSNPNLENCESCGTCLSEPHIGGLKPSTLTPRPFGPSAGDPVVPGTGAEDYRPAADLTVYCELSEPFEFRRSWVSNLAIGEYGSPGLAKGWVHGWDLLIQEAESTATWKPLDLVMPAGQFWTLTPVLDNQGVPTGAFDLPAGSQFQATGTPSATAGLWDEITLLFRDQTTWRFEWLAATTRRPGWRASPTAMAGRCATPRKCLSATTTAAI